MFNPWFCFSDASLAPAVIVFTDCVWYKSWRNCEYKPKVSSTQLPNPSLALIRTAALYACQRSREQHVLRRVFKPVTKRGCYLCSPASSILRKPRCPLTEHAFHELVCKLQEMELWIPAILRYWQAILLIESILTKILATAKKHGQENYSRNLKAVSNAVISH